METEPDPPRSASRRPDPAGAGQVGGGGGEGRPATGGGGVVETDRPEGKDGPETTESPDHSGQGGDAGGTKEDQEETNGALIDPEPEEGEIDDDRPSSLPPPPPGSATRKQLTTLPEEEPEEATKGDAPEEESADDPPPPPTPRARSSTTPRSPHPAPRTPRGRKGRPGVGWEAEPETADDKDAVNGFNGNGNNGNPENDEALATDKDNNPAPAPEIPQGAESNKGGVAWEVGGAEPAVSMGVKQGAVEETHPPSNNDTLPLPLQEADSGVGSAGEEPDLSRGDDLTSPRPLVGSVPHGGRGSASTDTSTKPKAFSGKSTLSTRASTLSSAGLPTDGEEDIDSINVAVRVRPASTQESQRKDKQAVEFPGNGGVAVDAGSQNKSFTFNVTFEPQASQEDVFDNCGVKKLVEMALDGYSCTAFAFGQTGSGKTHTITGPPELFAEDNKPEPELYGLIPRSFHFLFRTMNKRFGNTGIGYRLFASYMEIYNEQVIDLLNPNQRRPLAVRWSKNKGFYVENLFVLECETMDDIMAVLEEGLRNRATGSNSVNEHSSRSHSMLTLHIDSEVQDPEDDNVFITKHGKLTFVDLAGSEKVKTEIQNTAGHLAESNNINKSLLVLGNCISALGDAKRRQGHIPYRDSKLTKLLADSLGGNGVTLMIACISPSAVNAAETLNTLRYANRAKKIKTKPAVKMDPREKLIMSLKREIKILRQENHYLRKQLEFPPEKRGLTMLEFPVKPKGQIQKENDERFLQMLRDHQESGGTGITDHGLYEMLQEYMIENETLRTENSDLHQLRDTSRREQQVLARENEKLLRKLETMERERMLMHTPLSIYSVGSSTSRQTSASELQFERTPHNTPPAWGHNPPPMEYYGRDSTQGSWVGTGGGGSKAMVRRHSVPTRQAPPHETGPVPSYGGPGRSRNPPAHLQHPMRPPHRLSEPVVKHNSPGPAGGYEMLPPGLPPGVGVGLPPVEPARTYVVTPGQQGPGRVAREDSLQSNFYDYMAGYADSSQRNNGYMSRYYQQQDYYRDNPPGNPPPKGHPQGHPQGYPQGQPQGHPQGQPQGHPLGYPQGYPQGHPAGRGQGWVQPQSDYSSPGGPPAQYGPQSQGPPPPNYNNNYGPGPGQPPYAQGAPPQQAQPVESPRGRQQASSQRSYNSYNQDHPVPVPRKTKGNSPASQGGKSNYSKTGPAKKPAQKAAPPPPPEPKDLTLLEDESIEDMNERLKRELMDLEGAIKSETQYKGVKANGYGGRR